MVIAIIFTLFIILIIFFIHVLSNVSFGYAGFWPIKYLENPLFGEVRDFKTIKPTSYMKWITRAKPKIDRIACPWLIKKFIDPDAEFLYVPFDRVMDISKALNAIPFDVIGAELSHRKGRCTFDILIEKYKLQDPALAVMAPIIRGADTDRHDLASQSSGLWAIAAGMAHNIPDDLKLLDTGMIIYDALYSWATHLQNTKHTEGPVEQLLVEVYHRYLKNGSKEKIPAWATELKSIIQDQIDTNLTLSLTGISNELNINPAYISREFNKYFDNLTFGEYIRKLRVEKAINYIKTSDYSLSEIAYLTGFSDQSHFARTFKLQTGLTPSQYRKTSSKSTGSGKTDTNS
jgi:AraC-like DNA-binding protein